MRPGARCFGRFLHAGGHYPASLKRQLICLRCRAFFAMRIPKPPRPATLDRAATAQWPHRARHYASACRAKTLAACSVALTASTLCAHAKSTRYEDHHFVPGQHDVRAAGEVLAVQPKPETRCKKCLANEHFRRGVFALDLGHQRAALGRRHHIRHSAPPWLTGAG